MFFGLFPWMHGRSKPPAQRGFQSTRGGGLSSHPARLLARPHSWGAALGPVAQPWAGLCSLLWSSLHLPEHPHWDYPGSLEGGPLPHPWEWQSRSPSAGLGGLCCQLPGGPSSRPRTGAVYPESSLREVTDGGKRR